MKQTKTCWGLFAAFVVGIVMPMSVKSQSKLVPSRETIKMVKMELSNLQSYLPTEGGVGMLLIAVKYDDATNTIRYRYRYTVSGVKKPSWAQLIEAKKLMITIAKSDANSKRWLEQGISYRYDYYSVYDEFLYSITLTPEDMRKGY